MAELPNIHALIGAVVTLIAALITAWVKLATDAQRSEPSAPVLPRLTGEICAGLGLVSLLLPWRELHFAEGTVGQAGYQMLIGTCSVHGTDPVSAEDFGKKLQSGYPLLYLVALALCLYISLTARRRDGLLIEGILGGVGLGVLTLQMAVGDRFIRAAGNVRLSYGIGLVSAGIAAAALPIIARWNALSRPHRDRQRTQNDPVPAGK
jgi:hypothetical protein